MGRIIKALVLLVIFGFVRSFWKVASVYVWSLMNSSNFLLL